MWRDTAAVILLGIYQLLSFFVMMLIFKSLGQKNLINFYVHCTFFARSFFEITERVSGRTHRSMHRVQRHLPKNGCRSSSHAIAFPVGHSSVYSASRLYIENMWTIMQRQVVTVVAGIGALPPKVHAIQQTASVMQLWKQRNCKWRWRRYGKVTTPHNEQSKTYS